MAERRHAWPVGHWDWYQHLAFKHGVAAGDLIFVGGQVDKDSSGAPLHLHDLSAQTGVVVGHIDAVLRELGAGLADVTRLVAFYADGREAWTRRPSSPTSGGTSRSWEARRTGSARPSPRSRSPGSPCPAWWSRSRPSRWSARTAGASPAGRPTPPGCRRSRPRSATGSGVGEHVWVSGQTAGGTEVGGPRRATCWPTLGADLGDAVKLNVWFAADGAGSEWERAARAPGRSLSGARPRRPRAAHAAPAGPRHRAGGRVGDAGSGRREAPPPGRRRRGGMRPTSSDGPGVRRSRLRRRSAPARPGRPGGRAGRPGGPDPPGDGLDAAGCWPPSASISSTWSSRGASTWARRAQRSSWPTSACGPRTTRSRPGPRPASRSPSSRSTT